MHQLIEVWFNSVLGGPYGYLWIVLLMALGSTPIPVPAEAVLPPAAFLAAQGRLTYAGVLVAGTAGAYLGAAAVYWISRWIGRPLVVRYGRFVLLSPEKLDEAERWLARYEAGGIFFARLLPVVRHLISIPAGIVRMNFGLFSAVTIAGSGISCAILGYLGRYAYRVEPQLFNNPEAMVHFVKAKSIVIVVIIAVFAVLYLGTVRLMKRPPNSAPRVQ
jgi:membrane protein DedA with SNARE-associated domain